MPSNGSYRMQTRLDMLTWWAEVYSGEYDSPFWPADITRVIDIGANCGSFMLWAAGRWPSCQAYVGLEPQPENFALLRRNSAQLGYPANCIHGACWPDVAARATLVPCGAGNAGEYQLRFDEPGASAPQAEAVGIPCNLVPPVVAFHGAPTAGTLCKVDTEGAEVPILRAVLQLPNKPQHVVLEYHSGPDQATLTTLLVSHGYFVHTLKARNPNRGILGASVVDNAEIG